MKKVSLLFLLIVISLIATGSGFAHVQLDSPLGGETFLIGDRFRIQWTRIVPHNQNNWDLYFSSNGGTSWEVLGLNMDTSQVNFLWTVPEILTENARIRIVQDNIGGDYVDESGDFIITDTFTFVEKQGKNQNTFVLYANYPNPFNPTTVISYQLPLTSHVELTIYDISGKKVETLVSDIKRAGYHSIEWDASNLSAGAFFIRLEADEFVQTKKSILLK